MIQISAIDYVATFLPHSPGKVVFRSISSFDVSTLLVEMPRDAATGLNNLQSRLLKIASPAISSSLAYIFNKLSLGSFPEAWKKARVATIHKKGTRTHSGNCRPISILPVISKILERIVHNPVYNHLSKYNILSPQQS